MLYCHFMTQTSIVMVHYNKISGSNDIARALKIFRTISIYVQFFWFQGILIKKGTVPQKSQVGGCILRVCLCVIHFLNALMLTAEIFNP